MTLIAWGWSQLHLNHIDLKSRKKFPKIKGNIVCLMGKQQCLLQSLWIDICENLCFWFWFWRRKGKQESVTPATQETSSCVLDPSTLPWHAICFKLLGLLFSNFTAAPNFQHLRFSCCLFQSDKCISRLNICILIISEFLGLEVRIANEDNTWYKIIVY